ncbi:MAG: M20/M25/M40 family metallo-hydrolase [Nibricoccus sp.]
MGYTVQRQEYPVGGVVCANLVVERTGTKSPAEVVVIGAHYDSVPQTPGADDNASGVAALLALAEKWSKAAPERTVRFVAFTNEEPIYFQTELMGSRVYAKACKARGDRIAAMLSLETMGYFSDEKGSQKYPFPLSLVYPSRGNFIAVVGNRESKALVKRVRKTFERAKVIPVESASLPGGLQGVGWSDHWSFWQEGYPAVMITDTAPFRNPNYHKPTDTVPTLDYVRLGAAVRGLETVLSDLSAAEPGKKEVTLRVSGAPETSRLCGRRCLRV